jgi:phosphate-selective porin OprO/OprP
MAEIVRYAAQSFSAMLRSPSAWKLYSAFLLAASVFGMHAAHANETDALDTPADPTAFSFVAGESSARVHGLVQLDRRRYLDDVTTGEEEWLFRRVRPTIEATFRGRYDVRITGELADGNVLLNSASLSVRLHRAAKLTAGKFKMPVSLSRLISSGDARFMEHPFITSLVPNLGIGVQLSGELGNKTTQYALGYFNAASDGSGARAVDVAMKDGRGSPGDLAARIFVRPFGNDRDSILRDFGFGVAGTYTDLPGSGANALLPTYRTPGQQTFFRYRSETAGADSFESQATLARGARWRVSPQAYYFVDSIGGIAEYVLLSQEVARVTPNSGLRRASLEHSAWQLQVAWLLTGEQQSIGSVVPNADFSLRDRTWGAFELAARAHALEIDAATFAGGDDSFADPASASSGARSWGLGFNWYPNRYYRWSLDYDVTRFKGAALGGNRPDEMVLSTRFALQF